MTIPTATLVVCIAIEATGLAIVIAFGIFAYKARKRALAELEEAKRRTKLFRNEFKNFLSRLEEI